MEFQVKQEKVGFIVYVAIEGVLLSMGDFSEKTGMDVVEMIKIMKNEGGFPAEPKDALAFFLFQDRAEAFVNQIKKALE